MATKKRIALISTGGTIEKTYDELQGVLDNRASVLDVVLASLQLQGVEIVRIPLMNKDSLQMTPQDHDLIARTAGSMAEAHDGVVIVHAGPLTCDQEPVPLVAVLPASVMLVVQVDWSAPAFAVADCGLKSLGMDHALDGEVMIAFAMNGASLPMLNGYPIRLVVPGWAGGVTPAPRPISRAIRASKASRLCRCTMPT